MLIHNFIEHSADRYPDKTAVVYDNHRISYSRLNDQTDNLAAHLKARGVGKGDRVAVLLENSVAYITSYYATLKAGAVAAPLNPAIKPEGLQYLLDDLEPAAIITSFKTERLLKAVSLPVSPLKLIVIDRPKQKWQDLPFAISSYEEAISQPPGKPETIKATDTDLASIIYTSGSTGRPKGVMLSHRNIVSNVRSICQYLALSNNDIQMVVLPFFYVMGKSLLNTHMAAGGTVVINNRFMYPADVVHQMVAEKVTGFSGVPSTFAYLLNRSPLAGCKDQLNHLRYCSQAGGHMARSLKLELRKVLPEHTQIVIMYGATEASARLTYLEPAQFESKLDSIGKPIPGVSIGILDEQGREVPNGKEGELVASGPNIMMGYWKDPADTARVLDGHGYHTGDIGYRDAEGFLHVLRRKDGLVKISGHRVNPTEVEDVIMATSLVIETAVIGVPDKLMGNRLSALVVFKQEEIQPNDLLEQCAAALPGHKLPSQIIPLRALPKNASGKIDKQQCIKIAKTQQTQKK
ncbi:MAG: class I adenylate-forming enzyme family protein [Desulfobacteraceae bacterium]|jgi:acyl-CoA synthetase (AMP-forming)/AMP-acid ligase II